jgi:homocysteine S-methyltransferase
VTFTEALHRGVLLGDGANGTLLASYGYLKRPYDLACIDAPELVKSAHRAYFAAGSDFVETNTFEANRLRLGEDAHLVHKLNFEGAMLARSAANEFENRYVLGAIGPCGKPVEPIGHVPLSEVAESVAEQAKALVEGGVDGFMLETFTDLGELKVAIEAVRSVTDLPILASKSYIEDGETLAEGLPVRFTREIAEMGAVAVGANCVVGPQRMLDLVRMMAEATSLPILAFPTPGVPQLVKGMLVYDTSPEYFAKAAARLVAEGATIVGGCCGTTPDHIAALRVEIDTAQVKAQKRAEVSREAKPKPELLKTPPSQFGQRLAEPGFVTAVEMDVPRGLLLDRLVAGVAKLKDAGVDVINISDGARARLRMTPTAVAVILKREVGIEVTMHFSCRDRNLLAIQADLLAAHALGVRNILAVTGDPTSVGDYPSATSVFDVDAIGLVRILARFNEGIDLAGNSIGVKAGFTIAVAFNPLAQDQENELDRLRRKADAGANVVYTQPLFDIAVAEGAVEACRSVGLPCLVGILPLRNARHAEFMHNEVPGVRVPDRLRALISGAPSDAEALTIGVDEAGQLASGVKSMAKGVYLMPPFGSAEIALQVLERCQN